MPFYWDKFGFPKAQMPPERILLSRFLEQDVGSSTRTCRDFIDAIQHVASQGGDVRWEWGGNAHSLEIFPTFVRITPYWDPSIPPLQLTIEEFSITLATWLDLLHKSR